jgi:hypothetical protein
MAASKGNSGKLIVVVFFVGENGQGVQLVVIGNRCRFVDHEVIWRPARFTVEVDKNVV